MNFDDDFDYEYNDEADYITVNKEKSMTNSPTKPPEKFKTFSKNSYIV